MTSRDVTWRSVMSFRVLSDRAVLCCVACVVVWHCMAWCGGPGGESDGVGLRSDGAGWWETRHGNVGMELQ